MAIRWFFFRNLFASGTIAMVAGIFAPGVPLAFAVAPPLPLAISPVPLALAIPAHPQVLFAIANSGSMDGDFTGAIMTGSGSVPAALISLSASSSPLTYTVPPGFTPPLTPLIPAGSPAPYTVNASGTLYDNGASRLNVAKGGLQAILQTYMQNTDFALMDYKVSPHVATTWVYYMSPAGGFRFANAPLPVGNQYVANPCFGYVTASVTVNANCTAIAPHYNPGGAVLLNTSAFMQISATSDQADVNDVLYAGGQPGVWVDFGGPNPPSPFPPSYTLAQYNAGGITVGYTTSLPTGGALVTGPTNAGYVPYSTEVMYAARGFGYYSNAAPNQGQLAVPMTAAATPLTTTTVNAAIAKFTPFLAPETNNGSSTEIKSAAVQSPIAGLLEGARAYLPGVPAAGGCHPAKYVILITDGLPTQDLVNKSWPPLGSASGAGYGVSATFNGDGSLNTTNDQALTDTIAKLAALKTAGINTYVVGLGAGVNAALNPTAAATLTAMAVAGGTTSFFPATSPAALVNDLNVILISIQAGSLSTSAAAVNTTSLSAGSQAYQASFTAFDTPYIDWTGNLKAFAIDPVTGAINTVAPPIWSAQTQLDAEVAGSGWDSTRRIATWNPAVVAGVPFRWTSLSAVQLINLQAADSVAIAQARLNYLRGDVSNEKRKSGVFRNRTHILGDIVDSAPVYVGPPTGPYADPTYASFQTAQASRPARIYVAANDGMVHGFDATTAATAGNETSAFIPNGVFANLANLSDPLYNTRHQYFVDGSPQAADVQFADASWHTLLVGGEAAGGNTIYALDVTNPVTNESSETNLAHSVLWEKSDIDMGLSFGTPVAAPIHAAIPNFALFFGNGYNSPQGKPFLYAVDPQTGVTIRKIDLCAAVPVACDLTVTNGLASVTAANANGIPGAPVDMVYAGDLQGNLWAVDVSNAVPALWNARVLFQARDGLGNRQAITTAPSLSLNPNYPRKLGLMAFFGTGQFLTAGDLTTTQTQSFYGVWDNGPPMSTRANLQAQTIADVPGTPVTRTATSNVVNWGTQVGFYFDLPDSGERSITDPILAAGDAIFTTYAPSTDPCSPGGTSFLMAVSFRDGGAPSVSPFGIPGQVGASLGQVYATTPSAVGSTRGNIILETGLSTQVFNTTATGLPVLLRTGWWQLLQ